MRIVLTGGTGFLGRYVLKSLLQRSEISQVFVFSRNKLSHSDPRVTTVVCDLTSPVSLQAVKAQCDAIIHLAGLYAFEKSFEDCYLHNVLATSNLLNWAVKTHSTPPRIIHASTYAVGLGAWDKQSSETRLFGFPPRTNAYAHCKALAEKTVLEYPGSATVLRLGVLVANSVDGEVEKFDGPYYLLKLLNQFKRLGKIPLPGVLPIPGTASAVLPLVPVDIAASVFTLSLFKESPVTAIYGVYNEKSATVGELANAFVHRYFPRTKVILLPLPKAVLTRAEKFTGIPKPLFDFSGEENHLHNPAFTTAFPEVKIPLFKEYSSIFFAGFERSVRGGSR